MGNLTKKFLKELPKLTEDIVESAKIAVDKERQKVIDSTARETAPSNQGIDNTRKQAASAKTGTPAARRREAQREQNPETIIDVAETKTKKQDPQSIYDEFGGRILTNVMGDVTDAATEIRQIAGVPLRRRLFMEGGYKYSRLNEGDWASTLGPAQAQSGKYQKIFDEHGDDPLAMFIAMDDVSGNFATMLSEASIDMLETLTDGVGITEKTLEQFDRAVRNQWVRKPQTKAEKAAGKPGRKVKRFPDWNGVSKKLGKGDTREQRFENAYQQLTDKQGVGDKRKAFMETVSMPGFRNKGFPDWRDVYEATTAERLIDEPVGSAGGAIMIPDSQRGISLDPDAHRTYTHRIHGKYDIGELQKNVAWKFAFPKTYKLLTEDMGKTPGNAYTTFRTGQFSEKIDQEWLDSMMKGVTEAEIRDAVKHARSYKPSKWNKESGKATTGAMMITSLLTGLGTLAAANNADAAVFTTLLTQAVKSLPMKKGSVEQMVNGIKKGKGISQKEIDMIDWDKLGGKKSVTKDELGEFVEEERPKIDIAQSGAGSISDDDLLSIAEVELQQMTLEDAFGWAEVPKEEQKRIEKIVKDNLDMEGDRAKDEYDGLTIDELMGDGAFNERLLDKLAQGYLEHSRDDLIESGAEAGMLMPHSDYRLGSADSGKNYREIYINLDTGADMTNRHTAFPNDTRKRTFDKEEDAFNYIRAELDKDEARGFVKNWDHEDVLNNIQTKEVPNVISAGHMSDQPNNLAWARITEREGPNGEKVMQIEEIQSDSLKKKHKSERVGDETDFRYPELAKVIPKDWRKKVMQAVMKIAKEEDFDGVTWAKNARQVDDIERWGNDSNSSYVVTSPDGNRSVIGHNTDLDLGDGLTADDVYGYNNMDDAIADIERQKNIFVDSHTKNSEKLKEVEQQLIDNPGTELSDEEMKGFIFNNVNTGINLPEGVINSDPMVSEAADKIELFRRNNPISHTDYEFDTPGGDIGELINMYEDIARRINDNPSQNGGWFAKTDAENIAKKLRELKRAGFNLKVPTQGGELSAKKRQLESLIESNVTEIKANEARIAKAKTMSDEGWTLTPAPDEMNLSSGQQRIVDQYTKEMPQYAKDITGADAQSIRIKNQGEKQVTNQETEELIDRFNEDLYDDLAQQGDGSKDDDLGLEILAQELSYLARTTFESDQPDLASMLINNLKMVDMGDNDIAQPDFSRLINEIKSKQGEINESFAERVVNIAKKPGVEGGEELNYVPVKDFDIDDPIWFGKPPKVAAAVAATGAAGTASASESEPVGTGTVLREEPETSLGQTLFPDKPVEVVEEEPVEVIEAKQKKQSISDAAVNYMQQVTGLTPDEIKAGVKGAAGFVEEQFTGDKRMAALPEEYRDLPELGENLTSVGSGDLWTDIKVQTGLLATYDPEEQKNILISNGFEVEDIGDVKIVTSPHGKKSILNKPGYSQAETKMLGAEAAAFTPVGRGMVTSARAGLPIYNQAVRAFGGGMLTDAAQQEVAAQAGSGSEYDLERGGFVGGMTAAFPVFKPIRDSLKGMAPLINPIEEAYKNAMPDGVAEEQ